MDAEAEEVLNELNLLSAEGDDTNMGSNKEDSDWTKSMGESSSFVIQHKTCKLILAVHILQVVIQIQLTQLDVH